MQYKHVADPKELREQERQLAQVSHNTAIQDYNIMMGILEDPSEEEEGEEDE